MSFSIWPFRSTVITQRIPYRRLVRWRRMRRAAAERNGSSEGIVAAIPETLPFFVGLARPVAESREYQGLTSAETASTEESRALTNGSESPFLGGLTAACTRRR
jgi:hypothetical protein